jgi:drug/metabolite transporter (DMT)-like permease
MSVRYHGFHEMISALANVPAHLALPLLSGLIYVGGALFLKRAAELGANVWRSALFCNLLTTVVFAPLAFFGGKIPSWSLLWQPALVGLFFVLGQVFTLLSLRTGDVTIATPVLAVKIILVAFLTTVLIGETISGPLWTAAILSTVAVGLLQFSGASSHRNVSATIVLSGLAAMCYALLDVHVQKWSPAWGFGRFLPLTMGFAGLFSLGFCPAAKRPAFGPTPFPTRWVACGSLCLGVQAVLLVSTIAIYGQATLANVLYSSRGLWSVVAVWLVGKWFNNREQHHGARVLAWRFCGAALLMTAIVIVLATGRKPVTKQACKDYGVRGQGVSRATALAVFAR